MKPHMLFLTASAVILTAAGLAIAGEPELRRVTVTQDNDDGKVTCEMRVTIMGGPAFADIDADHNGSISPAEFDAFHAAHHPDGPPMSARIEAGSDTAGPPPQGCGDMKMQWSGGPDGPGGPGGLGGPGMEKRRIVIMQRGDLDADKDGKVTFEEFSAPMKKHFAELDANHDGALSGDELKNDMPPPPPPGAPMPPPPPGN